MGEGCPLKICLITFIWEKSLMLLIQKDRHALLRESRSLDSRHERALETLNGHPHSVCVSKGGRGLREGLSNSGE